LLAIDVSRPSPTAMNLGASQLFPLLEVFMLALL
jgi:hypothetical protein